MPLLQDDVSVRYVRRMPLDFQVAGGDGYRFSVVRFSGTEGLCRLYRFEIDLAYGDAEPVILDELVGRPAVLNVRGADGDRHFHGIIGRFEMTGEAAGQTHFRVELVPTAWLLTHRYDSRIYQNKSVPEIVADVLERAGIPADHYRFALEKTYPPREYCVQYRETDYNFIARLLEEEGIWWCFEQHEELHILLIADVAAAYAPIESEGALRYVLPTGLNSEEDHVFRFRLGQSVRPGAVLLNEFNFENPALDLRCEHETGRDEQLRFSDYPGDYGAQSDGVARARVRAEEFEATRITGIGQSGCRRLAPGRTFELSGHPSAACNGSYLLTAVRHEGKQPTSRSVGDADGRARVLGARLHQAVLAARQSDEPAVRELAEALLEITARLSAGDPTAQRARTEWVYHAGQVARDLASVAGARGESAADALTLPHLIDDVARSGAVDFDAPVYQCRFECVPAAVTYRPPRITPWPEMRGTQTARVVGPAGEEIYCDEYGRVKVQFNWDRVAAFGANASCWIRVSQGLAGGNYGMLMLPRVGQEVIVDFLEGNPNRPIIIGSVYNRDHMPPYKLPEDKTISAIRTCSSPGAGGANEIRFDDAKDKEELLLYAHNALHLRARGSHFESTGGDRHATVGKNAYELVKEQKHSLVKLDLIEQIDGSKHLKVEGDVKEFLHGKQTKFVNRQYNLLNGDGIWLGSDTSVTLWCNGNFIKLDKSGITIMGKMVNINSGGSAEVPEPDGPTPVEEAKPAATTRFGQNVRYTETPEEVPPAETVSAKQTSWIEIELVDELGQPRPAEEFVVVEPDGTEHTGATNVKGLARVALREPGACQISFPKLDAAAWERL
ncbi:MAG: type VI secretion system tip protein VgrG [Phycisphaerales bacterium]|nr:type VI secretion system tip protein VgrG [Phycisphaerales bacterium]